MDVDALTNGEGNTLGRVLGGRGRASDHLEYPSTGRCEGQSVQVGGALGLQDFGEGVVEAKLEEACVGGVGREAQCCFVGLADERVQLVRFLCLEVDERAAVREATNEEGLDEFAGVGFFEAVGGAADAPNEVSELGNRLMELREKSGSGAVMVERDAEYPKGGDLGYGGSVDGHLWIRGGLWGAAAGAGSEDEEG